MPLLTVYRSNRADLLAQLLAQQLLLAPPDPFETLAVVVNTWPTSRWLGEQLAEGLGGIAANLRFPFPGSQLRRVVDQLLGEDPAGSDPWQATDLVWPLLELLPELVEAPEAAPLRRWLDCRGHHDELDPALWQLGRAIADGFDDLTLYRPAMAAAWWNGLVHDGRGEPLPESHRWQPLLFARLRERLGVRPFGLKLLDAIERLRRGSAETSGLTGPLRLFGLSSAPPIQVQLLQALSGAIPVDLYLLTPCRDLWQRCADRRRQLSDAIALQQPFGLDWLLKTPGLEARFGRLGGEFQQLLEGTGETQLGSWQERDLFFLPASAATTAGREPSLLEQLQEQLVEPAEARPLRRAAADHSLEFHACPGRLRQVQIVRDRLLQLMAADPGLEPRHILVMTPEVDRFAPLVASVFGDTAATGVELPWRLTDRSQQSEAGIACGLLQLLRLGGERLTATALEALLENEPLKGRFQLETDEPAALTAALQDCGFRWGLDGSARGGALAHSLSWAIDRLLLGLVLPDRPGLAVADCAPHALAGSIERQGRWIQLLTCLRRALERLGHPRTAAAWGLWLPTLLSDLFGDGGDRAWELQAIRSAIADWQESAEACPLLLGAPVVASVLEERLSAESGRFGHRSGALTISALEPMRAIPYRVIVLMGLDAAVFPRQRQRPGFHPMEQRRLLGDPDPADQDRYVLLEALLSARDHLLLCWTSREERRGDTLPPATPVRQWLEQLRADLDEEGFQGVLVEHAVNPLDRRNFLRQGERPAPSCDRRLCDARRRIEAAAAGAGVGAAAGLVPRPPLARRSLPDERPEREGQAGADPYDDLCRWLVAPQRQWLRELGLRPKEWAEAVDDLEPLELDERGRAALLRGALGRGDPGEAASDPPDWTGLTRGRGLLPPLAAGQLEVRGLERRWASLQGVLNPLGEPRRERHRWQPAGLPHTLEAELDWRGDTLVLMHTARPRPGHRLELWLQLLLAVVGGAPPARAVLIARDGEGFTVQERLRPPQRHEAIEQLEQLLIWREAHRLPCWPVPPASGWTYALAEQVRAGSGKAKAAASWEGNSFQPGERNQEEMALCFGAGTAFEALLTGIFGPFQELACALYAPLLELRLKP